MTTNKSTTDKQDKAGSTNQKILDAAEQLFAQKSYEGTTLREIAKQVGIREPSLYAHFPNKEAIYGGVIDRALQPFYSEISQWNDTQLSLEQLLDIPRSLLALHEKHPNSARILHKEFTTPFENVSPQIVGWLEQMTEQIQQFLSSLPDKKYARISKQDLVTLVITLSHITLGGFSSQGIQQKLLGDAFNQKEMLDAHKTMVDDIFIKLLGLHTVDKPIK
jgi:AcrR family transcriptional regulator